MSDEHSFLPPDITSMLRINGIRTGGEGGPVFTRVPLKIVDSTRHLFHAFGVSNSEMTWIRLFLNKCLISCEV